MQKLTLSADVIIGSVVGVLTKHHPINWCKLQAMAGEDTDHGGKNSIAIETEPWFFNDWIASGIYNDLMDLTNTWALEDAWDITGGLTIKQLYEVFGPNMDAFCSYRQEIISRYGLNEADVIEIFNQNNAQGCL